MAWTLPTKPAPRARSESARCVRGHSADTSMLVWVFPFVHSFVLKTGIMQGFRKIAKWGKNKTKRSRNNSFSPIATVEWRKIGIFLRLAWIDPRKTRRH